MDTYRGGNISREMSEREVELKVVIDAGSAINKIFRGNYFRMFDTFCYVRSELSDRTASVLHFLFVVYAFAYRKISFIMGVGNIYFL